MAERYIHPKAVQSPKQHWQLITVLDNEGAGKSAVALGRWDNRLVLAMRWNGDNKGNLIGNPQSRGIPTWFVIPDKYYDAILKALPTEKQQLVSEILADEAIYENEAVCMDLDESEIDGDCNESQPCRGDNY